MHSPDAKSGYRRQYWLHLLQTFVLIGAIGAFALPYIRSRPKSIHEFANEMSDWLRISFIFMLSVVFTLTMFKLFSPRLMQLQYVLTRPPTWLAAILGIGCLAMVDILVGFSPKIYTASVWEWLGYGGGAIAFVSLYQWLTAPAKDSSQSPTISQPVNATLPQPDWQSLELWLRSDAVAKYDFLGNRVIAQRLKNMLLDGARSIGIIGPFGAGKTSIVGWIVEQLESPSPQGQPTLLMSQHSCWGFENSSSAIQSMLSDGIAKVAQRIDTFHVSSLPESYRQMFSVAGEWFDKVSKLIVGQRDPIEQFRALSALLADMNARLVFVVEDLDRNGSRTFDIQDVLAFLQQLKEFENLSFVLTAGINAPARIDFAKLCDHIEYMKTVSTAVSSAVVQTLRERCLNPSTFPHEVLTDSEDNPWSPSKWIPFSYRDEISPPEAIARLLNTPRSLRHALSRTHRVWQELCGEVDWDHLFAINVLRFAAPEAFSFAVRHWHLLRDTPSGERNDHQQVERIRERLRREWTACTERVEWDARAARTLLDVILPATPLRLDDGYSMGNTRIQGIHQDRYWRRACNEVIDPSEVRDQVVIRDLRNWLQSPVAASELVRGLCRSEAYSNVWEDFAPRFLADDSGRILLLCGQVLAHIRSEHFADASVDSQGFIAVWRYANRHVERGDQSREWLKGQITEAATVSLELVNNLWHYWGSGQSSILRPEDRAAMRGEMLQILQAQLKNGQTLARLVHPKHRYVFYQLVFDPSDDMDYGHVGAAPWQWLAPLVLEALQQGNETVAIGTCSLIAARDSEKPRREPAAVDPEMLFGFFGDLACEAVNAIEALLSQIDEADRQFVNEIVRTARNALMDREGTSSSV